MNLKWNVESVKNSKLHPGDRLRAVPLQSVESKLGRLSLTSLDFLTHVTILRDCSQSIQETLEETVHIKIICAVKGYQEWRFRVDLVESIFEKMGSKGRLFKMTNTRGKLGHLERANEKWIPNKIESDWVQLHLILFDGSIIILNLLQQNRCSITEPNWMICDWLGSIEFWFDFVWLDMPGMFDTMLAKYFVGQEAVILLFSSYFFKFHRA